MLWLPWAACRLARPEPDVPLNVAAVDVLTTLDLAVDRADHGNPAAAEAWTVAHDRFQATLEPALRERVAAEELLAIEYGFARVRSAIDRGEPAALEVDALSQRLQQATRSPVTVAKR